jgi:hypothetical protein
VTKEELLAGVEKHFIGKTPETVPGIFAALFLYLPLFNTIK